MRFDALGGMIGDESVWLDKCVEDADLGERWRQGLMEQK